MKNYLIILLSIIAEFNAIYLTKGAYLIKANETNSFVCDINTQLSCSSVFQNDFAWLFGVPFAGIAIGAYGMIILITILGMKGKIKNHFKILFGLGILGLMFNGYIIAQEAIHNSWCLLCLMCTAILITITVIAFKESRPKKAKQVISV